MNVGLALLWYLLVVLVFMLPTMDIQPAEADRSAPIIGGIRTRGLKANRTTF